MCRLRKPRGKHEAFPVIYVKERSRIEEALIAIVGGMLGDGAAQKLEQWYSSAIAYAGVLRSLAEPSIRWMLVLVAQAAKFVWEFLLRTIGS